MTSRVDRGNGIGIEFTPETLRAVRLEHRTVIVDGIEQREYGVAAAVEVPLRDARDDRATLDAFIRLRIELGGPTLPTRLATFPAGSSMRRLDVTGVSGPELNTLRSELDQQHGASSTVLVDSGPRRWMYVMHWDPTRIRRLEDLAERAGFADVSVDPSPLALARVCPSATTFAERASASGEAFAAAIETGTLIAAASIEAVGRTQPDLRLGHEQYSITMFDDVADGAAVADQLATVTKLQHFDVDGAELRLADTQYPNFPPHDLRAPERQCVALGAAAGAGGLAGRLRPIDIVNVEIASGAPQPRPWAVEQISSVPTEITSTAPGPVRRLTSRLRPRRTR